MREATTVILSEMAARLSEEFKVPIATLTPYDWWKRSKKDQISIPMPLPIRWVGRSPVFLWRDIRRWYAAFKDAGVETSAKR